MPLDDDALIADDCIAFRLVRPDWVKPDRPSSAAFQDHPDGKQMSVFLSDGIADAGCTPEELAAKLPDYKLCYLTVGELRELGEVIIVRKTTSSLAMLTVRTSMATARRRFEKSLRNALNGLKLASYSSAGSMLSRFQILTF
jgi:hypothetical protein